MGGAQGEREPDRLHRTEAKPRAARHHLHRAKLAPDDRTTRDNISTTRLARTFLDLAALSRLDAVVRALEEAERLRLIDMRQVDATLQRANGHPGSGKLTQAIKAYEPRHLAPAATSSGR